MINVREDLMVKVSRGSSIPQSKYLKFGYTYYRVFVVRQALLNFTKDSRFKFSQAFKDLYILGSEFSTMVENRLSVSETLRDDLHHHEFYR